MTGRTVIITGGAGKLSQSFAIALGSAGATVALADLNRERAEHAATTVKDMGIDALGVGCDVASEADIKQLFDQVQAHSGRVDSLIHNVMNKPENYYASFETYDKPTWEMVLGANLTGAFILCREAAKRLGRGGSVVLTGSVYGMVGPDQRIYQGKGGDNPYNTSEPLSTPAAYSASKAGLLGLVRHLAALWGSKGIRINMLTPGGIEDGQSETFVKAYSDRTPLKRMASWEDYQGAILLLCSEASRYMTGANLVVDGGWTAW